MGEMSSFYGGRRGFSFILRKTFDGYDIPQPDTDPSVLNYTYGKAYYAVDTYGKVIITDSEHGGNVLVDETNDKYIIKRNGTNYEDYNWLFKDNNGSQIDDTVYYYPTVIAQGLKQCFNKGVNTLNDVGYSEFVIIDSVVNMCNWDDPDNGKIYQRGGDFDNIYNDRYICQITGPKGDTILVDMDHFSVIEAVDPHLEITYSEANQDLIPGSYIDEGIKKFNDDIKFAYTYVRNSLGNIEKCLIGFRLPTLVEDYEARSVSPYVNRATDPQTGKYYNYDLIEEDENYYVDNQWIHPFYQKWQIKVPHGYHGINSTDFDFVPTKTKPAGYGGSGYTGTAVYSDEALTQPYLVSGEPLVLTTSYDTLRGADYQKNQTWMAITYDNQKLYVSKNDCYYNILRYKETNFDNLEAGEVTYFELGSFEPGHAIIDPSNNEYPNRRELRFLGSQVVVRDDNLNEQTVIEILRQSGSYFGTSTSQAANQNKVIVVSADQDFKLQVGAVINIKFDADNTYNVTSGNSITLNVNNTGAKAIYYGNTNTSLGTNTTAYGRQGHINQYIYDGTYWVWTGSSVDNDQHYTPESLGIGYGICATAENVLAKEATLNDYVLTQNGIISICFNNAVSAGSTLNVNNEGAKAIYFKGLPIVDKIIKAGNIGTFFYDGTRYQLIAVDSPRGGHIIQDITGTNMPEREKMQFLDSEVIDDSVNEKTLIRVVREMTQVQFDALSAAEKKGVIKISNGQGKIYINGELLQGAFPEMTLAQYNALPVEERPHFWIRTDLDYNNLPASSIGYDNTNSRITHTNVQEAIDEIADAVLSTTVRHIVLVTALPSDAASHTDILYLIKES